MVHCKLSTVSPQTIHHFHRNRRLLKGRPIKTNAAFHNIHGISIVGSLEGFVRRMVSQTNNYIKLSRRHQAKKNHPKHGFSLSSFRKSSHFCCETWSWSTSPIAFLDKPVFKQINVSPKNGPFRNPRSMCLLFGTKLQRPPWLSKNRSKRIRPLNDYQLEYVNQYIAEKQYIYIYTYQLVHLICVYYIYMMIV